MPQQKRRSAGSTLKGNIHSRPEEKGAEKSRRRLAAGRRPAPGAVRSGAGRALRRSRRREPKWRRRRGGGGSGVGKRGWLLVFGAGGGSHSCSCTSGRHFVLRGRDETRETHTQGSFPPRPPPLPPSVPTHPTPPSRREGRPRRLEDWFPGGRRCPPGSSGPRSGVCECFYVGEGGGGGRRSSDLSSRLVSPRLYMFPALRRRKRSRSHPPSRPGL